MGRGVSGGHGVGAGRGPSAFPNPNLDVSREAIDSARAIRHGYGNRRGIGVAFRGIGQPCEIAHDNAGNRHPRAENLELLPFRKAIATARNDGAGLKVGGDDVGYVHRLLLVAIVVRSLLGLAKEEPRPIRAMRHRLKLGREIDDRRTVEHLTICVHDAGHVKRLLVAPFDLDAVHARRSQRAKVREHVHILRVHDERAATVLLDGEMLARALLLLERVAPAAGLRAVPAVARAAGEIGADEAAP